MSDSDERKLALIYKTRLRDAAFAKGKRRRALEAGPRRLNALLETYFSKSSPSQRDRMEECRAMLAWETYVGRAAALVSTPLRIRNGSLTVQVTDPLWMQQLSLLKQDILARYRRDFSRLNLKDIYFTRHDRSSLANR